MTAPLRLDTRTAGALGAGRVNPSPLRFLLKERPFVWKLISIGIVLLVWEIAGRVPISFAFPPASEVFLAFCRMIADGSLPAAFAQSRK